MFHIYFTQSLPSITDWIQAIGVIVASIGLVVTLLLQRKTLKEQQKITLIEQENFINKYLPQLELRNVEYLKDGQHRVLQFNIYVNENHLQNIKIQNYFPERFIIIPPRIIEGVILPSDFKMFFQIKWTFEPVIIEVEEYTGDALVLIYDDAIGNKYFQALIYKGGANLFLEPAKRLETKKP